MVNSTTRAFGSPFKYVQGPGEFKRLPEYSKPYGKACVIIDSFLYAELNQIHMEKVRGSFFLSVLKENAATMRCKGFVKLPEVMAQLLL